MPPGSAVRQAVGEFGSQTPNAVPNGLQAHAADPRRFSLRASIVNRRQRQQMSDLVGMITQKRQTLKTRLSKILATPADAITKTMNDD